MAGATTRRVARAITMHPALVAVLAVAALLRLAVALTYGPALMWTDSWQYVAATDLPGGFAPDKPNGYPLFLIVLGTGAHLGLVTTVQHVVGLLGGVVLFAVLRRLGCGVALATVATAVVLLDGYAIALEQHVLAEALFTFVLICWAAVAVAVRPAPWSAGLAGALLVVAATLRPVALFVIPVWVLYVAWRHRDWASRAVTVGVVVAGLGLYSAWHDATAGGRGLNQLDGWQLYGRVAEIGECAGRDVPRQDRELCPPASDDPGGWGDPYAYSLFSADSPMRRAVGDLYSLPTDRRLAANARLRAFAREVIVDRPVAFAGLVGRDTAKYFAPGVMSALSNLDDPIILPERARPVPEIARRARQRWAPDYEPPPDGRARVLPAVQRWVHTPRWLLALLVVAGVAALATAAAGRGSRWRAIPHRPEIAVLLGAGLALLAGSALSHFEPRYLIPAVPLLVAGGAVALSGLVGAGGRRAQEPAGDAVAVAAG